jgi:hypothetical protein
VIMVMIYENMKHELNSIAGDDCAT